MDVQRRRVIRVTVLLILVVCLAGGCWYFLVPSTEHVDLQTYYAAKEDTQVALILDHEVQTSYGLLKDGKIYLTLEEVQSLLNQRFYWDGTELLYALPLEVRHITAGADTFYVEDGFPVLALDLVAQYTNLTYQLFTEPSRVWIWRNWTDPVAYTQAAADLQIRTGASIHRPILTELTAGGTLLVLDDTSDSRWAKVQTTEGLVGYAQKKQLGSTQLMTPESSFIEPEYTTLTSSERIGLVWHQITNLDSNAYFAEMMKDVSGINVVSPTWFTIADTEGNLLSYADRSYVDQAHAMGLQVWALLGNIQVDIDDYAMLSSTAARTNLIRQVMEAVQTYDLDGINVDIESIDSACGSHYLELIRELSASCRAAGVVLSVDNYVPAAHTRFYDRAEQGRIVGYVIVMGYDEHWGGDTEAGSTASLPFVEKGITDTLKEVPAEKLINGIPFYMRDWEHAATGLTSVARGMDAARAVLEEHGAEITWQKDLSQYYGSYLEDGIQHEIWLEDTTSIQAKLEVMSTYGVAGVACWKLGMESAEVWPLIREFVERPK